MAASEPDWKRSIRKISAKPVTEPIATNVDVVGFSDLNGKLDGAQLQLQGRGWCHRADSITKVTTSTVIAASVKTEGG